jgi:Ribonuclease G/E
MPIAIVRVRVRGIYATALTKLFLDAGFQIVQASKVISERFKIPQLTLPADVTVKDADDPNEVLVIGYPEHARKVVEALMERLSTSFYWRSKLPLHSSLRVRIDRHEAGTCLGRVRGVEVEVVDIDYCEPGSELLASVVKTAVRPGERPRVRPGVRVVGDYAIVFECRSRTVTYSEHIRSLERRALLASIATTLSDTNTCIHWRSSAQYGDEGELRAHLIELYERLQKVREELQEREGPIGGEEVVIVRLSSNDKRLLDELRRSIVPTAPLHHSLKSMNPDLQDIVDLLDVVSRHVPLTNLARGLYEYLASKLAGRRLALVHVKPDGSVFKLGEGHVTSAEAYENGIRLTIRRIVRSEGVYDGLGVAKEPGDVIETTIDSSEWYIIHRYYSASGELKGIYVNINTPPEIGLTQIQYLDLGVDVVKKPSEQPQVIDLKELIHYTASGVIPVPAFRAALEAVVQHAGREVLENALTATCAELPQECRIVAERGGLSSLVAQNVAGK